MAARTGRHGPRTRTACLTCHKRRVKCDEERPRCRRCIKAGRSCEGYQLLVIDGALGVADRVAAVPQLVTSTTLLSAFAATEDEWQAYRLYAQRISSTLGGPFDAELWQKLIIRISYNDAAVRNAIFTLGNLFRHRMDGNSNHISMCSCGRCVQALKSYNKAITSFADRSATAGDPISGNTALASCALFICIEYYRQNDRNAIVLINKGCGILSAHLHQEHESLASDIDTGLWNLFGRLRVQSAAFGRLVNWPLSSQYAAPKITNDPLMAQLNYARTALYDIMVAASCLRRYSAETLIPLWPLATSGVSWEELHQMRESVLLKLQKWNEKFTPLIPTLESELPQSSLAAAMLYGQFLQTTLYTESYLELSQECFEKYLAEFQWIATAAELYLCHLPTGDRTSDFSFESCFLSALYLCTLKCREPRTRRRLIDCMRFCREKEGPWHREELIRVASRVMELEEGRSEYIPTGEEHAGAVITRPIHFHDVLCQVNYVAEGKTMVDVMYVLYKEHPEQRWLSMKETLVVE